MCGRAAQTHHAVRAAAESLGLASSSASQNNETATAAAPSRNQSTSSSSNIEEWQDNYNMSPGMDALVIWKVGDSVKISRKVWGLVSRGGTKASPLAKGMNQHFSNLMFNARSDTLYQKPTFARLASIRKTCIIALDGFFEWKADIGPKKQPYYIYPKATEHSYRPYLLLPGLWTSVPTGREEDAKLDTFTIITTDVCKPLEWLHDRMPVCIWDEKLALQWLDHPSEMLLRQMEEGSSHTPEGFLQWHAVTKEMSTTKFRSSDSIKPIPQPKTVKSFFKVKKSTDKDTSKNQSETKKEKTLSVSESSPSSSQKRVQPDAPQSSTEESNRPQKTSKTKDESTKKGTIQSFFSPKAKLK